MVIRAARMEDLPRMMAVYATARQFMRKTGNPDQWKDHYPPEDLVKKGIEEGKTFLCVAEGPQDGKTEDALEEGELLGVFYFAVEADPTYSRIYEGSWLQEGAYGVVHRVASSGCGKGFARACFDWAGQQCLALRAESLRIDTHRENRVMQHVLEKAGFVRCGIIYLEDGAERLAYQKLLPRATERTG